MYKYLIICNNPIETISTNDDAEHKSHDTKSSHVTSQ